MISYCIISEVHSKVTRVVSSTINLSLPTILSKQLAICVSSCWCPPFLPTGVALFENWPPNKFLAANLVLDQRPLSLFCCPPCLFILSTILIMTIKNCSLFANRPPVVVVIDKGLFCPQNCIHTLIFKHQDGQIMRWLLNTWHYKTVVLEYGCCSILQQSFTPICTVSSCFQWPHRLTATCE